MLLVMNSNEVVDEPYLLTMANLLFSYGADISAKDYKGCNLFCHAVNNNFFNFAIHLCTNFTYM